MTRLDRLGALAGPLAGVLWLVSVIGLEVGGNPAGPASADELLTHYRENRTAILVSGLLHSLAGFFFLWFLASVHSVLTRLEASVFLRTAALAGGIAAAASMLALFGPQTTGATTDAALLSPDASLVFWRLAHTFFVAAAIAFAVFVAALSLLALAGVVFPRWLGWAGVGVALVLLIGPIGWIGVLFLLPLWLVATGAVLYARWPAA